ncbi:MAG: sigma-70 family RNA polymerase sigma factor [Chloroflexota bacterium]
MSEQVAIARLKRGDIDGLEEFVLRYQAKAIRTAYLICRDLSLSEDIVQAAFLHAYERIDQFDSARSFAPWFLRIVVNDAVKAVNRRKRTISLDRESGQGEIGATYGDQTEITGSLTGLDAGQIASYYRSLEEQLERLDTTEALSSALAQLPTEQRAAVVMRYYLGLTDAEISERLDCTPGTVRWRLYAARERLRRLLPSWARPGSVDSEEGVPVEKHIVPNASAPSVSSASSSPSRRVPLEKEMYDVHDV